MMINKKRIKWGRILVASLIVLGAAVGLLKSNLTRAYEGEYWTVIDGNGTSLTVLSVEQNDLCLTPQSDGQGGYYFDVANNTDAVRVTAIVDGMQPGESYYYYPFANDYSPSSKAYLTSENNGYVLTEELKPHVYFQDEDSCHGGCYEDPFDGVYYVGVNLNKENGFGIQKNIALRPASIGSQNIDIISVQQNDIDLALTNNEYQITDYHTPVEVTYKLRNLVIGRNYGVHMEDVYYEFVADNTERTETRELNLDYTNRHIEFDISLYSTEDDSLPLYFKVVDEGFKPVGDIVIDGVSQGGVQLLTEPDTSSGWRREYTFEANDAQGLIVNLHSTNVTDDINYYVTYSMYGTMGGYLSSDEPIEVTGEELGLGIELPVSAAFGMKDSSPFTLNISVSTIRSYAYAFGSRKVVYQDYGEYQSSDAFLFNFYEDENVPRFDAAIYYSDGTIIDSDMIDPSRHDAEHPLIIEIIGERYNNEQTYDIRAKAVNENRETIYDHIFTATGAELNEGIPFSLEGLALTLPEFNPSGSGSGGYEGAYDFSLEIDGLKQGGTMLYAYEGWINSLITFDGGEVAAMGAGGGVGGSIYITNKGSSLRKTSLDASKGAVLNYLGHGFDESLDYDYDLYYNGDTGEEWWSAEAGILIDNGTLTGTELNNEGLSVNIATPSNESLNVMYTLVLTTNGGLVRIVYDNLVFTNEPKLETFKFTADSDSFMQTDWSSYRVAKGTDILATLTGDGFDDETEYRIWVSYEGYRNSEEEDEWGYSRPEWVDLTELNNSVVVTGAQLNAGYVYNLDYVEALDDINFVEIGFAVSDRDVEGAEWYQTGEGRYTGHGIHIDYVNDDEVFRDNGYQINEDGTITDVSQPDDPHGPDEPIPVDDKTPEGVDVIVEGGMLTVVSERPVMIVGHRNNDEWVQLYEWNVVENGEERTNHYSIGDCSEVVVALKGNLKDDDTTIDLLDANVIYRSQLNPSSPAYLELTPVEEILADLNGDHIVDLLDANVIYRSQLNPSSPAYQEISW